MNDFLSDKIRNLDEYKPNTEEYKIRLDANESPYDLSSGLLNKFRDILLNTKFNRYPDPYATSLINNYALVYQINPENIVAGNGSDELISIICNSFLSPKNKVLVLNPDFSMYAFYSGIIEADIVFYEKNGGYEIDFDELLNIVKKNDIKLVIFSNPCNPTGIVYDRETILNFVVKTNCLTVVDEAYMDFCTYSCKYSVLDYAGKIPNLIVLKTLSKLGLAALRVGFAISTKTIIDGICKVKSPYNVNSFSQSLASTALENFDEFKFHINEVTLNTHELFNCLKSSNKYEISVPSTNFITIRFDNSEKPLYIYNQLHKVGISVRYIMKKWLRITCGTTAENAEFVKEFNKLI